MYRHLCLYEIRNVMSSTERPDGPIMFYHILHQIILWIRNFEALIEVGGLSLSMMYC